MLDLIFVFFRAKAQGTQRFYVRFDIRFFSRRDAKDAEILY
jgi:hypothetical protein